jgi:hypothetical protein
MLDEFISGLLRATVKFFGWFANYFLFEHIIDPIIYSIGKCALRIISLGQCKLDNPSNFMNAFIYIMGGIILIGGAWLIFRSLS